MISKFLPVWYGGSMRKLCNAVNSVGHLSYTGLYIPKYSHYELKENCRNPERQRS